ncbi:MAG: STAS domain-containing protein [Spirochaetota bacterium]|nr:STAS domain-containing protein [Spirochaetota bacterium]
MRVIELSEEIGIKRIREFYSQLSDVLSKESEITLDFSRVVRVDLSVVQVIMAALRESRKSEKKIMLKSLSRDVKKQFQLSGMMK